MNKPEEGRWRGTIAVLRTRSGVRVYFNQNPSDGEEHRQYDMPVETAVELSRLLAEAAAKPAPHPLLEPGP